MDEEMNHDLAMQDQMDRWLAKTLGWKDQATPSTTQPQVQSGSMLSTTQSPGEPNLTVSSTVRD